MKLKPKLKAPFPYFGGKSKVAELIWRAFGDVQNYVEPFYGSGAVHLARPIFEGAGMPAELINDMDGMVINFWRAVKYHAEEVANICNYPMCELSFKQRARWLQTKYAGLRELLESDVEACDAEIAGWWVYYQSSVLGKFYFNKEGGNADMLHSTGNHGLYGLANGTAGAGNPVYQQAFIPSNSGELETHEICPTPQALITYFQLLCKRLRRTKIMYGDFARILTPASLGLSDRMNRIAVLLDPPYPQTSSVKVYSHDSCADDDPATRAYEWAKINGNNPALRIAVCGYEGQFEPPQGWTKHFWKTGGGFGNTRKSSKNENAAKERIWFSPHCLTLNNSKLF